MSEEREITEPVAAKNEEETPRRPSRSSSSNSSIQELIGLGKELGLSGPDLREFIREQQDQEREERRLRREAQKAAAEAEAQKAAAEGEARVAIERLRLEKEIELEKLRLEARLQTGGDDGAFATSRSHVVYDRFGPPKLPIPKFENKQLSNVSKYLDIFESVVKQNGYEEEIWPLSLRTAVIGTKLENVADMGGSYKDIKREILTTYGQTPEKLWHQLVSVAQGDESFRQLCVRAQRKYEQFIDLAQTDRATERETVLKYLLLESCSVEMRTFLIEHKIPTMTFEDFQELGVTFQEAHGRPKTSAKAIRKEERQTSGLDEPQSTANVLKVSVDGNMKKLGKMTAPERRSYVMEHRLCFNCLRAGHQVSKCRSTKRCDHCGAKHHSLLHPVEVSPESKTMGSCLQKGGPTAYLMTAVAGVQGGRPTRVFFDPGAQTSFVSTALVRSVQAPKVDEVRIAIQAFGAAPKVTKAAVRRLTLVASDGSSYEIKALEQANLKLDIPRVSDTLANRWKKRGVCLSDVYYKNVSEEVHVLIGADHVNRFLLQRKMVGDEVSWRTPFGWVVSGPSVIAETGRREVKVSFVQMEIQTLWELDQPPVRSDQLPAFPLRKHNNRYEVGLLWRSDERPDDNRKQAVAAARSMQQKLKATQQLEAYRDVLLKEYAELDAIEREPNPDQAGYYMPHHAVTRKEAATTKLRVVFNASAAKRGGRALNDVVDPGPSLIPDLTGMLLRFREFQFAFQADIRKAFFMIAVEPNDRPFLRFVWIEDNGTESVWRLTKLPFGVNCAPFIMTAVLQHHLRTYKEAVEDKPAVRKILDLIQKSFYVDDCVSSVPSADQANSFRTESTQVLSQAGMDLRKWRGNSDSLQPNKDAALGKVLGLSWNCCTDTLSVATPSTTTNPDRWTRRTLLGAVSGFYDPLGLVAPVLVVGKILLQRSWKEGGKWDDALSEELAKKVAEWWGEASILPTLKMQRWAGGQPNDQPVVHMFTDASEKAYGCCIYLLSGQHSTLLYAKAKVAPVKVETLPRLELQAAYLGSTCVNFVCEELRLELSCVNAWTDSSTVWHWLQRPAYSWVTWVANRVARIQEVGRRYDVTWRYCPGELNPADVASRGATVKGFQSSDWLSGPKWLSDPSQWPEPTVGQASDEVLRARKVQVSSLSVALTEVRWWERLSVWKRILNVGARLLSWRKPGEPPLARVDLLERAEKLLLRIVQAELYAKELSDLQTGKAVGRDSKLHRFAPFLDRDGLIRVGGRLQMAQWEMDRTHPILLGKHSLTEKLVEYLHVTRKHQGVEALLAFIYTKFWIVGGRRLVRSVKRRCVRCRLYDARCCDELTAPLPEGRVIHQRPFKLCGIDHAGPLFVRGLGKRATVSKVWIVLFACGSTRALHLELTTSLSTEEFLLAFRRFAARRCVPEEVISDNASTFKAAASALQVRWKFNPPGSPWYGGFYERLVKAVKDPIKKTLGRSLLSMAELSTVIVEVEQLVNSRPLSHVGSFDDELPITPNSLLGNVWAESPGCKTHPLEGPASLNKRVQYARNVLGHLKQRWEREYVSQLRQFQLGSSRPVEAGEVVYVADPQRKRQRWKLAVVQRTFAGRDGRHRVAEVRIGQETFIRPLQRLIPLEVRDGHSTTAEERSPESIRRSGRDRRPPKRLC